MSVTEILEGDEARWEAFRAELGEFMEQGDVVTDPLRRFAYGTDASCYRMVPRLVIKARDEPAVVRIVQAARRHRVGITFRAAGTSLAGQAVTDSVLVLLTDAWRGHRIEQLDVEPGVLQAAGPFALELHRGGGDVRADLDGLRALHVGRFGTGAGLLAAGGEVLGVQGTLLNSLRLRRYYKG